MRDEVLGGQPPFGPEDRPGNPVCPKELPLGGDGLGGAPFDALVAAVSFAAAEQSSLAD